MEINHGFGFRSFDLKGLFKDTNKLSTLMRKIEKQSIIDPLRYDPMKYRGDAFEFFVEILLKAHSYDNRLGITEYEPIEEDDNGVDGIGLNIKSEKSVFQIKYRTNTSSFLTANNDSLSNMISDGMIKHKVVIPESNTDIPRHYIVTTAKGLHHYTDNENFKGYVYCIGFEQIKSLVDDNKSFWDLCRKISERYTN